MPTPIRLERDYSAAQGPAIVAAASVAANGVVTTTVTIAGRILTQAQAKALANTIIAAANGSDELAKMAASLFQTG